MIEPVTCRNCVFWEPTFHFNFQHGMLGRCELKFPPNCPPSHLGGPVYSTYECQGCHLGRVKE